MSNFITDLFNKIKAKDDTPAWFEELGFVRDTHEGWNKNFIDGFDHATYLVLITQALYTLNPFVGLGASVIGTLVFIGLELKQGYKGTKEGWGQYDWKVSWFKSQNRLQDWLLPFALSSLGLFIRTAIHI